MGSEAGTAWVLYPRPRMMTIVTSSWSCRNQVDDLTHSPPSIRGASVVGQCPARYGGHMPLGP